MTDAQSALPVGTNESESEDSCGHDARPSRIPVEAMVTLNAETQAVQATACDVSERGVKIELEGTLPEGPVTVKLPGFPIFSGEVRWQGARHIGIRFLRPIPWDFLTAWVKVHGFRR